MTYETGSQGSVTTETGENISLRKIVFSSNCLTMTGSLTTWDFSNQSDIDSCQRVLQNRSA